MVKQKIGNYEVGRSIGEGSTSKVKLGVHSLTNREVALKMVRKSFLTDKENERLQRETRIMSALWHENIIKLFEVVETDDYIVLVLEHAKGGELFEYIVRRGRLNEKTSRHFLVQIISGMIYCHERNVFHRDLKPENLLLDENQDIKITDFGFSNVKTNRLDKLHTFCGSPAYASPEMIGGRPYIGHEVDVWSIGVILFTMLSGSLPFDSTNENLLPFMILNGEYSIPPYFSPNAADLIKRMMALDPKFRIRLRDCFFHPFINVLPRNIGRIFNDEDDEYKDIDSEVVNILLQIGIPSKRLLKSVMGNRRDSLAGTYYILKSEKMKTKPEDCEELFNSVLKHNKVGLRQSLPAILEGSAASNETIPTSFSSYWVSTPPQKEEPMLETLNEQFENRRNSIATLDHTRLEQKKIKSRGGSFRGIEPIAQKRGSLPTSRLVPRVHVGDENVRIVRRGPFNVETSSFKDAGSIYKAMKRLFKERGVEILSSNKKEMRIVCSYKQTKFEIEICALSSTGIKGLRIQRISGDIWIYKGVMLEIQKDIQKVI